MCDPLWFNPDNLNLENLEIYGDPPKDLEITWDKVTQPIENIGGEIQSSAFIDGSYGEYDLTKGHFYCFDPYPDLETAEE